MKNLKIIIFILLIILPFPVFASYEHFKVWDMSDGLSNNTVKSITQDHLGFIWLGTFDGLCKFDGVDFTIFRHDLQDSLSIINNHVEVVASVRDELWVGTEQGLNLYSYKENNFRLCEWILPTGERQKITESIKNIVVNQGNVFVLTFSHELLVRKKGCVFEPCDYKKNIEWLSISGYKEGLLIGHATDGLYVIDPDEMRIRAHFPFDSKVLSDCLYYSANKDMIFLGFGIGYPSLAFRMNKENSLEKLEARIPSSVKTIVDYKDETLFGTDGNGLMVFNEEGCSGISSGESDMSSDAIYSLFVDRGQNLWIGTYRGGLNASSEHYDWFQSFCVQNKKLSYDMVTAVISQKERLYVGLDGGGLNIYDMKNDKLLKYATHNSGISGDNLLSLSVDEEFAWLGIYGKGLSRYSLSGHTFKNYALPSVNGKESANRIWQIRDDGEGNIWIIAEDVYCFHKKSETFTVVDNLSNLNALNIIFAGDAIWLCTMGHGLYKFDRKTTEPLEHYFKESEKTPIPGNMIRYMFIDSRNQVWFSIEYAGLYKLDQSSGRVIPYGVESGLTDTNVVGMLEDKSGYLWVSTYNGLFRYNPVNGKFIRFGKEDNLTSTQFNYNACFQEGDTMYFGSTGGLFSFKPEDIKYDGEQVNHVYFTSLELLNHENKIVSLYGMQPENIYLSYDQNFFTIHFSTPELISPDKVQFSCYMENFENGWSEISHVRQVSYTNIPPGEYYFYVKASDNEGQWTDKASCLKIIITPPWWKTTWALFLWGILILGLIIFIFWLYRHELNIKHLVHLNEIEKKAAKNINEAKLSFYTNITHELRTPIFLITSPLEELLTSKEGRGPVSVPKSFLVGMYRNAMKLNKLISRIIDFRKLESGKLKLEPQSLNLVAFCKDLTVDYEALCQQKNIIFHFLPSRTVIRVEFDPEKMEILLSNLISNAFKYTPEGGKIVLSIDETDEKITLVVEDNGIGIKKEFQDAIFERFFQVENTEIFSTGDGIGLSFVKHLVELHDGTIHVESELNKGAKFIVELPKKERGDEPVSSEEEIIIVPKSEKDNAYVSLAVESASSPAAPHTLLIIDDESEILDMLERFLSGDFKILKASNGMDGLSLVQTALPDIIICDVMMPKMSGTDFLQLMKGDKKLAHIPVIMLTAKTSEEDQMVAFDCGADAYLTKPISLKYLRKRIDQLLARVESAEMVNSLAKTEKKYSKEEQKFLLKCREVIDNNLNNSSFEIMAFAEHMGMSHSTLYRKIKGMTGMTVVEFINEYRLFKAVQYFKEGETNIGTVCAKCGFNDVKHFRDLFKRKMNMTPKQYVLSL